jgi:transcriptional regulator with XRE-family HTH domain
MLIRLRDWRERRGLSVRQLADRAGVGFATVHRIEVGRLSPTVAMLEKLARALRIGVRDFFPVQRQRPKRRGKR